MAEPRILQVLEALEGGTARHLVDVVLHTSGDHHVVIPTERVGGLTDRTAAGAMEAAGATIHRVEMHRFPTAPANASSLLALRRLMRRLRPDVIHGHSSVGGALARLAAGPRWPTAYTPNAIATARAALTLERALGWVTDRLVAVSESEADFVRQHHLVRPDRIVVIPNGIELDPPSHDVDLRGLLGVPPGAPLVGTVSRLVHQKAPDRFASVASELLARRPDVHVVLIGDGPLRHMLGACARDRRFHHLTELPSAGAVLGQLDVFVLTSRFEGFPYSTLEAMRYGTPVVLTDVVGNRDTLIDGNGGVLVAEDDLPGMVEAVLGLLADAEHRGAMGEAAAARAAAFDVREMGRRLGLVYGDLASR